MVDPLASRGIALTRYAIDPAWPGEEDDPDRTLTSTRLSGVRRLVVASLNLARLVRQHRPDVLHLHCEAPEIVGLLTRILTPGQRFGLVVTNHSMGSWSGRRALLGHLVSPLLKAFGAVFVDCFQSDPPDGRDPVIFNPIGTSEALRVTQGDGPRLVLIGRLIESKRIDAVLTAAKQAGWRHGIVIVGAGYALEPLQEASVRLGIDATFTGHQSDPWASVRSTDIFVTASAFEGEPLTLIEAIQRELPVLASDIPGHVRVLGDHAGIFRNEPELVEILAQIISEPGLATKYKLASRKTHQILADRDPENIASQWESIYSGTLRTSRKFRSKDAR